jgi:hypothetical protein
MNTSSVFLVGLGIGSVTEPDSVEYRTYHYAGSRFEKRSALFDRICTYIGRYST